MATELLWELACKRIVGGAESTIRLQASSHSGFLVRSVGSGLGSELA